ncbi:MAG TPA: NAD-glutamate dehydrogenase domain-containing protein, partial [Verrucomicrobiae bacterium]|nr:NAD-glutamate dehydrogenase domain-containing protein [Verrucomicrobiae bacterium]
AEGGEESRVLFAVANPPQSDFLVQVMEVFNRLDLGVLRAYCLTVSNGVHPWFLGTFFVKRRDGGGLEKGSPLFERLRRELYATQILSTSSAAYRELVEPGLGDGADAVLVNAIAAFCHTTLAHNSPDRFGAAEVESAFRSNPGLTQQLVSLFHARFDPQLEDRSGFAEELAAARLAAEEYHTGHRHLDDIRRTVYRCALLFITHTLKTNFYVPEKQGVAFRLDPSYLGLLGEEFRGDLPPRTPFRVTFLFARHGCVYHIGFSDIARGGWRTVIAREGDDRVAWGDALFREAYVLAHTQHLKNKDIYEGGSKMVVLLDAVGVSDPEQVEWRLYKLQYGLINAFLDILVTEGGVARDPRVVDYWREDEPVELGPDENMHDAMIEEIARLSRRRGYVLGSGIISSKKVGINHREYGVTSTGVVKFAEVTLAELGIDILNDPFSVKFTGGPNGDVAGNAMRILLEKCPQVVIRLIVDGAGALCDLQGIDRGGLSRILLARDVDGFDTSLLHPGGFLLHSRVRRRNGLREEFLKVVMTAEGPVEQWVSLDDFHREYGGLVFSVPADLFIPGGGRPESVHAGNVERFFQGGSSAPRGVVEGANSFITPEARAELQRRGVVVIRDASANKCGVISSSYEIIANLLMTESEFVAHKERYVADVLRILERRAEEEARLIFRRRRECGGTLSCTEISDSISGEINSHYARLFEFFRTRPELCRRPLFR